MRLRERVEYVVAAGIVCVVAVGVVGICVMLRPIGILLEWEVARDRERT
jgi:hypothetical protein